MLFLPPVTHSRSASAGFSLIELLVATVVAGLLILLAVPFALEQVTRSQLDQTGRQSEVLLAKARRAAVRQQTEAVVRRSADDELIAFVDADGDSAFTDGGDELVGRLALPRHVHWGTDPPGFVARLTPSGSAAGTGAFVYRTVKGHELRVELTTLASAHVELVRNY